MDELESTGLPAEDFVPDPDTHIVEYLRAHAATRPTKSDAWAAWGRRTAALAMSALNIVSPRSSARPALIAAVAELLVDALASTRVYVAEGSMLDGMWEVVEIVGREASGHNSHAAFASRQRTDCAERRVPPDIARKLRARRENLTRQLLARHLRPEDFRAEWANTLRVEAQYRPSLLERVEGSAGEPMTVEAIAVEDEAAPPSTPSIPAPSASPQQMNPLGYASWGTYDEEGNDLVDYS